jgi:hypothetical protein
MARRPRLLSASFVLVIVAGLVAEAVTGLDTGLWYLAPALVLCAPLLMGRYVGEQRLVPRVRRERRVPRRAPQVLTPHSHVRVMQRGGRLVAAAMAKRPPPAHALHLSA